MSLAWLYSGLTPWSREGRNIFLFISPLHTQRETTIHEESSNRQKKRPGRTPWLADRELFGLGFGLLLRDRQKRTHQCSSCFCSCAKPAPQVPTIRDSRTDEADELDPAAAGLVTLLDSLGHC